MSGGGRFGLARRHLEVRGDAPAHLAWERYARPALWPTWAPQIRSVEASADRLTPGMTGVVHGPAGLRVRFVVHDVDETARTWSWTARVGPVALTLAHRVRVDGATGTGGCATDLDVTGPAPIVVAYAPVAALALRRLVRP